MDNNEGLLAKFMIVAKADFRVNNGAYLNAPYIVYHEGDIYKGRVSTDRDGNNCITIERPVRHMLSAALPGANNANTDKLDLVG